MHRQGEGAHHGAISSFKKREIPDLIIHRTLLAILKQASRMGLNSCPVKSKRSSLKRKTRKGALLNTLTVRT